MFILVQGVWRQVVLGMACVCLTSLSACAHTPSQQQAAQNQRLQNVCAHNILFKNNSMLYKVELAGCCLQLRWDW